MERVWGECGWVNKISPDPSLSKRGNRGGSLAKKGNKGGDLPVTFYEPIMSGLIKKWFAKNCFYLCRLPHFYLPLHSDAAVPRLPDPWVILMTLRLVWASHNPPRTHTPGPIHWNPVRRCCSVTNQSIIPHARRAPSNYENCFPLSLDGRGWGWGWVKAFAPSPQSCPQRGEEVY